MSPSTCSVAEAVEGVRAPDAPERFSPLAGSCLLAVDLEREGEPLSEMALAAALAGLRRLPCPTIGIGGAGARGALEALRAGLDVWLPEGSGLAALAARIAAHPQASAALAQLLRHAASLDVEGALVAESLAYATLQAGPEFARWCAGRPPRKPLAEAEPPLLATREGERLQLRLNRPARRNAYSARMRDALCEGLQLALRDESLREVLITGEGPAFCSGGDLDEFGSLPDPATAHLVRTTRSAARLLAACGSRVRVQLHGACIGAGAELPAFAARVEARGDTFFELPEVAMGLVPGAGGCASLPRRIGRQRTAWLALSGERLDAATAHSWGLVDAIIDGPRGRG